MSESLAKCQGIAKTSSHGLDEHSWDDCPIIMHDGDGAFGISMDLEKRCGGRQKEMNELPLASHRRFAWQLNAQR